MKKIVTSILVALMLILSPIERANATEVIEMDLSAFTWWNRCDEALKRDFGDDYRTVYPYAVVYKTTYRATTMYDGTYTYAVFSRKPLYYEPDSGQLMTQGYYINSEGAYSWDNSCVIRATCDYNGAYGTENTTTGTGTLFINPDFTYVATYEIKDTSGNVVFTGAPLTTKLATITEQSTRRATPMSQIISLTPLLIFLVASLVGLRKCLHMLRTILSKA